ncbi:hypothetical protein CEXT_750691 [Caerostris extrusa]|uniref:Uncharacterized protein n=1 Tax=Caerostris extrusa TaxID=172846 RepID=A0AAV4THT9_CAEEX|nr:hypothetical protein CEXT_750691 [Caerostris extrusa]
MPYPYKSAAVRRRHQKNSSGYAYEEKYPSAEAELHIKTETTSDIEVENPTSDRKNEPTSYELNSNYLIDTYASHELSRASLREELSQFDTPEIVPVITTDDESSPSGSVDVWTKYYLQFTKYLKIRDKILAQIVFGNRMNLPLWWIPTSIGGFLACSAPPTYLSPLKAAVSASTEVAYSAPAAAYSAPAAAYSAPAAAYSAPAAAYSAPAAAYSAPAAAYSAPAAYISPLKAAVLSRKAAVAAKKRCFSKRKLMFQLRELLFQLGKLPKKSSKICFKVENL